MGRIGDDMRLRRFLVAPGRLDQNLVEMDKVEANHARKVLRLGIGDEVQLLDGRGKRAEAIIEKLGREGMTCRLLWVGDAQPLKPKLVLCPGLAKGPAMDFMAAKLTELAVDEIRPFVAKRSEPRLKDSSARLERWRRLAGQALKQCGAPRAPEFFAPLDFAEALEQASPQAARLLLYERCGDLTLAQALANRVNDDEVWVFVGPEGGFEEGEAALATQKGFVPCGLSGTILRAETACLAAAAIIRFGCR